MEEEMVNRSIQQKILKRKRRGKFRNTGATHSGNFINTGSGPAPGAMSALYRHKLVDDGVDKWLATKYQGKVYSDEQLIEWNKLRKDNPFPLGEVKSLILSMREQMKKTILDNHFCVINKYFHKVDLFFSADKTCWMFIEMKSLGHEQHIRRSVTFSSKPLAMQALQLSMVEWVETVPLHQSPH
jgi:hypothetical protein